MYHRIADRCIDPWGLAVAPGRFEEQLEVLCELRQPLPMTDFVDRLEKGNLPTNAVGVTFDDGYVDNLRVAKSPLERAGVPATVFVASGSIGTAQEFWWDELARLILSHSGSLDCEITMAGECFRLTLPTSPQASARWQDWQNPRTDQEFVYIELWKRLRPLSHADRGSAMANLRALLRSSPPSPEDFSMTVEEVGELADAHLIQVGAHSVTHPVLTALSSSEMWDEITVSKSECERLSRRAVSGFAYPYGEFNGDTIVAVRRAGFGFACSTQTQFIDIDRFNRYALPRLQVMNWAAEDFERALVGTNVS